jgi:CO/xanthine dehydrogenase Mo-binding subunit
LFIGEDLDRVDVLEKVLGAARYAHDFKTDGMLFACVVRSTRPHARIISIDLSAAMAVPGVVRILSHEDIPGENVYGAIRRDQPFLAAGVVRCVGEPILIVIGASEAQAREAASRVRIAYADLPCVPDMETARKGGPLVHDSGNLLMQKRVRKGDVEKGFAESDVVVSHVFRTTYVDHAYNETEAGVGWLDEAGRIVIRSSTQNIHYKRTEVARMLAVPEEKIRVLQATTGGGFGGKLDVTVEGFLGLAVYHTGRPVMMRYTREESFLSQTKRHPLRIDYTMGAKKDGSLTAVKVDILGDTGPYASYGGAVCLRVAVHAAGPYDVPNVWADSSFYYTNGPVAGAMRGFGIPQTAVANESMIDEIALLLGIDPLDIRIRNAMKQGSATSTGQVLSASVGFMETLRRIEPFWRERKKSKKGTGFGLGCMYYGVGNTGVANPSRMLLELGEEGRVILHSGACEIGQGSDTTLLQILLETLGMARSEVVLDRGDTDTSRNAGSSSASRQTYISGKAVQDAALKLREVLEKEGYYKGRALSDIYRSLKGGAPLFFEGYFDPPASGLDGQTGQGVPYATYAFATHMTEVEVEESTGICRVKRVRAAHDVGRGINPRGIKGQICGGIAMGIGLALMEEFIPGKTESFDTYYIPTSMDMPEVDVMVVEEAEPTGPFGAKGLGEPALVPQAASIVNAVRDATGACVYDLPCHVERLKGLLEARKKG